jgi:type I restriction enzyme S subunit
MAGEWRELQFSEAVLVNPAVRLARGGRYPFVDMGAVTPGSRCAYAGEEREFTGGGSRFQHGDTLMARITPCLENGKVARYCAKTGAPEAHGSTEFIVIRGRPDITDTDFAYYLTQWDEVRSYAISQMTGTSGRQRVPTSSLDHLDVPIPPLDEQRVIAHILGSLDDKIELNRRMNETLEGIARAIFKSWFVDFDPVRAKAEGRDTGLPREVADLFPDRFEESELGEIPAGWATPTIGESVRVVGGSTPRTETPRYWDGGTIPWATPRDLASLSSPVLTRTERRITEEGLQQISSGLLPSGTVLLSSRAPIGYLAVSEMPVAVNQGFIAMVCDRLPNLYVRLWAAENLEAITAQANGTTFLEVSKAAFRPIRVLVPSNSVLAAFMSLVFPLHKRVALSLREVDSLAALRDTLLPKLISGDIRVPDARRLAKEVL